MLVICYLVGNLQGGSRPTLLDNPEEIDNHQPPIDDDTDTRNIQDEDEFRNQTGHDIISDTRKLDDEVIYALFLMGDIPYLFDIKVMMQYSFC